MRKKISDYKKKYRRSICWLRRDLRLSDHRALYESTQQSEEVLVVFVFDTTILKSLADKNDPRVSFIWQVVENINQKLRARGSALFCLYGDPVQEIPKFAKKYSVEAVFAGQDYEPKAKLRDHKVSQSLADQGCEALFYKDQVIWAGTEIQKNNGQAYRVFSAYKKVWMQKTNHTAIKLFKPNLEKLINIKKYSLNVPSISLSDLKFEFVQTDLLVDEKKLSRKLQQFVLKIDEYAHQRDFPGVNGTSKLSAYLRFGLISIRQCVRACFTDEGVIRSEGARVWLAELIWRDFFQMILDRYPHVAEKSFNPKYEDIKWPGKKEHFQAWCEGRTGFPIIDAAMRQLNQTGWMHNRLRMVVASFLVKDLLINWQMGEKYFARKLLDFDLSANNGGWQWCASTGCDAQPYFRIFNPVNQSKKFDPKGEFIRKYVPELSALKNKDIHFPLLAKPQNLPAHFILGKSYPFPLVVHSEQRQRALKLFSR